MRISDWSSDVCSSDLGHRAACEGRLPKHQDETAVMTKSAFNEKVRSLAKQEAALQARLEAAESSQDELIEAIARVQDLMDLGLDFDLEDAEGVMISGAAHQIGRASCRERVCQ